MSKIILIPPPFPFIFFLHLLLVGCYRRAQNKQVSLGILCKVILVCLRTNLTGACAFGDLLNMSIAIICQCQSWPWGLLILCAASTLQKKTSFLWKMKFK